MMATLDTIRIALVALLFSVAFFEAPLFKLGPLSWTTTELIIGLYILYSAFEFAARKRQFKLTDRLFLAFAALLVIGTISSLKAEYHGSAARMWIRHAVAALVYLGLLTDMESGRTRRVVILTLAASATFFALTGILEHFRCDLVDPWARYFTRARPFLGETRGAICGSSVVVGRWPYVVVRATSVLVHPNVLGYFLAYSVFLVWSYPDWRKLYLAAKLAFLAVVEIAIFYTYSRGALLAFSAGLVAFVLLVSYHRSQKAVGRALALVLVASTVLTLGLLKIDPELKLVFKRTVKMIPPDESQSTPTSPPAAAPTEESKKERIFQEAGYQAVNTRLELWSAALKMFREKPLLGIGLGQFKMLYPRYITRWNWDLVRGRGSFFAHNLFLHTLAELGALGLLALLFFIAVLMRAVWRFCQQDQPHRWALVAALTVFLVANTVDVIFVSSYAPLLVFCLMSALIAVESRSLKQTPRPE